eukprot:929668-Rhodomonas_salina.1
MKRCSRVGNTQCTLFPGIADAQKQQPAFHGIQHRSREWFTTFPEIDQSGARAYFVPVGSDQQVVAGVEAFNHRPQRGEVLDVTVVHVLGSGHCVGPMIPHNSGLNTDQVAVLHCLQDRRSEGQHAGSRLKQAAEELGEPHVEVPAAHRSAVHGVLLQGSEDLHVGLDPDPLMGVNGSEVLIDEGTDAGASPVDLLVQGRHFGDIPRVRSSRNQPLGHRVCLRASMRSGPSARM